MSMYQNAWIASAILAAGLLPVAANAADPASVDITSTMGTPPVVFAQAEPPAFASQPSKGNEGSASGISTNPSNNTTGSQALSNVPLPISGPPLIGLFPGVGRTLLDDGIDLHGLAFDHFLANPTAGNITGRTYNLATIGVSADLDLGKLLDVTGGNIHTTVNFFGLRSNIPSIITETGGFLAGFQTTPVPSTSSVVLSELTYEQKLLDGRLSIEVGRTSVYQYFLLQNGLDFFSNFSSTFTIDGDFPVIPFPVWGGRATYHFTPKWYVQAGAFEDNYFRAAYNPNNFGVTGNSGVQILGEVGYRSEFNNADDPANFELGAEGDTRSGVSNVKGAALLATPFNQATAYPGGGLIFFQGMKVLWRGAKTPFGPPPNIAVYGSVDASFDKPQPIDMDSVIGFNFTGFVPGRPFDALGVQVHYQRLSAIEANYETRTQNIFAGPGPAQSRDGYAFEVVGRIAVTPWLFLSPTVQYVVNPDDLFDPAQARRPTDGFVTSVFAVVPLGFLFGTSNKPF